MPTPAFASDPATAHYYDRRAAEYDEWYTGQGSFAGRERPGWTAEVDQLVNLVRQLPPARTLDVACGTAFLPATCADSSSASTRAPPWWPLRSHGCPTGWRWSVTPCT